MKFKLKHASELNSASTDLLVVAVDANHQPAGLTHADLNRLAERDLDAKSGATLLLPLVPELAAERVLLVRVTGEETAAEQRSLAQGLARTLCGLTTTKVSIALVGLPGEESEWAENLALQLTCASYRYATTVSQPKTCALEQVTFLRADSKGSTAVKRALQIGSARGEGINLARQLGNLPGNICTPSYLADQAKALAERHSSVRCKVLGEKQMASLGMGALLAVSAGSDQPAKLITLEYHGGESGQAPIVLVGKGITFDSGGISLKPGAKMDEMKFDMCGAASVLGTLEAVAQMALPINLVVIVAASENLPSGRATKPGDIVTSMAGKTIEILNTDAEGRLVLCDALTFAAKFNPTEVIDVATLTGACVVALGSHASGLYANNDELADALLAAGQSSGDRAWRMPLWPEYQKQLDSNFADMQNIGGPEGGSITAACFLSRFTEAYRWAHLDIAGSAWLGGGEKGATGRPVGLLTRYLMDRAGE